MGDPISTIASPIVKLAVEKLATLIHEEYLALAGLEKDVQQLKTTLTDIYKVLEIAEKGPQNPEVTHLLADLKDATYDAADVLNMVSTEALLWNRKQQQARFCPSGASKWIFRLKNRSIPDKMNNIMETFNTIYGRFANMKNWLEHVKKESTTKEKKEPTSGPVLQPGVVGRKEEKGKIIDMLLSDRYNMAGRVFWTPITGMGGIGKTTLAQQVYADNDVTQHFSKKIWVPVSNIDWEINRVKILEAIKEACAKDLSQGTLEEVVQSSVMDLKLLVVLDDVWSEDLKDWENLEKVLLRADKGTRVIVTSRSLNVFGLSPENVPIPYTQLQTLPHEDSLALFAKNAVDGDVSTLESLGVKTVADKVVRKCDGLPLALEVIGCLLRSKPLEEWSGIVNYDLAKFEEDEASDKKHRRTLPVLRVSYFHLSPRLKACFSFCSIFPKGYEFDKDELVKMWMAHSLIQPSRSGERVEHKGRRCFDMLRMRSFFQQQPDSEKYRMHDYMHELAELVSGKYSCILREDNGKLDPNTAQKEVDPNIRHMSLICQNVEEKADVIVKSTRLRTFLMPQSRQTRTNFGETLGKMLQTLKYLHVLDLSSSSLSELPKTVAELKLLCYLNLSRTEIKWLPDAICSLQNLQTLKLLECPWFLMLPKDLSRMIQLRFLEIDVAFWQYRWSTQPPNIGRLTYLQNLQKFRVGESRKGCGIEQLKNLNYLEGSLHIMDLNNAADAAEANLKDKQRLQVLELEWATERDFTQSQGKALEDHDADVLEALEPHSNLVELTVHKYCGKTTPSWLGGGHLELLTTLVLKGCKNMEALTLGRQPNLKVIRITDMQKLIELPVELDCPSLHTLEISNCPQLMQLPDDLPKLQFLKIEKCTALKTTPPPVYVGYLELVDNPVLEGFSNNVPPGSYDFGEFWRCKIMRCPKFEDFSARYHCSRASINGKLEIAYCESFSVYPSQPVTELVIDTCHKNAISEAMEFISVFEFGVLNDSDVSVHYLQSLTISNISSLISFPTNCEVKLVSLYIKACKDLEALFDSTESCKRSFPCLVNLYLRDCPKLSKFPEEGLPPKLEFLVIHSCPKLESLGPPQVLKDLHSLTDVYIENCPKLHSFPAHGLPSSVKHLRIQGCPELTKRFKNEKGPGPEWPKIADVPYLEIEEVQAPPSQHFTCFKGK